MNADFRPHYYGAMDGLPERQRPRSDDRSEDNVIFIRRLRLPTHIGAYTEERAKPQMLEFDLEIGIATNPAGVTDRLSDTIDYAEVVAAMRVLLEHGQFHLLEALSEGVAELVLGHFGAAWVRISVAKEGIVPGAQFVGVRITRSAGRIGQDGKGTTSLARSRSLPVEVEPA